MHKGNVKRKNITADDKPIAVPKHNGVKVLFEQTTVSENSAFNARPVLLSI